MNRVEERFCGACARPLRAAATATGFKKLPPAPPKPSKPVQATMPIDVRDVVSETPSR